MTANLTWNYAIDKDHYGRLHAQPVQAYHAYSPLYIEAERLRNMLVRDSDVLKKELDIEVVAWGTNERGQLAVDFRGYRLWGDEILYRAVVLPNTEYDVFGERAMPTPTPQCMLVITEHQSKRPERGITEDFQKLLNKLGATCGGPGLKLWRMMPGGEWVPMTAKPIIRSGTSVVSAAGGVTPLSVANVHTAVPGDASGPGITGGDGGVAGI